ncbi:hypothetical protein [Bradyrhizobium sp. SZCCHNS1054]|uniref:hypothetical protein n=1 Tax=Bradyrhizobium sp. SZCCHNS1054 TaxID=3057301 RepID=UPI0029170F99|nr:hypothetical protein [Bradyrhizobium sp. SZCCHNS1054]
MPPVADHRLDLFERDLQGTAYFTGLGRSRFRAVDQFVLHTRGIVIAFAVERIPGRLVLAAQLSVGAFFGSAAVEPSSQLSMVPSNTFGRRSSRVRLPRSGTSPVSSLG